MSIKKRNLRILREFRLIQFAYTAPILSEISQTEYVRYKTASNQIENEILKTVLVQFTFSQICGTWLFNVAVLWPFVNNGKEMNKELKHAYTAIVLVAVTIKLCLMKLPNIE